MLLISCDLSSLIAPAGPIPTPVPGAVDTIVAQTAAAAWTQTAAVVTAVDTWTPSATPPPSETPTLTPSPSPTFIFKLATRTPTPKPNSTAEAGGLACQLVSQTPADGTIFDPRQKFTATWEIKNTGEVPWDATAVDFEYFSGAKTYTGTTIYDLPNNVAVNHSVTLSVAMAAPKSAGSYRTVWTLRKGKIDFCHVDLQLVVH